MLATGFVAMGFLLCGAPAFAQGNNQSVEEIIKTLTPTGDLNAGLTRGIRRSQGPDAAAQPAAPAPTSAAPAHALPSDNFTVNFETGSAELTPEAMQVLDKLGAALSSEALSHYRFRIEGHTDTVGTPEYNKALSDRRAHVVADYIAFKFGVSQSRLEPIGVGVSGLLIQTAEQVPEPRNRRVQVINLGS
jgi:outer membrane protein OmpA-like peptidoglycan-associated protein